MVATDAVTKNYKGVTHWVAPEAAPAGIAQAVYEALKSYQFQGSVSVVREDVTADVWHGRKLNILGGLGEWITMDAAIHQSSFDIDSGTVTLTFGPAPYLAAEDFLELQRMLRGRQPTWMSQEERTSNELGATDDPGSKGDTVAGFDIPETIIDPSGGGADLNLTVETLEWLNNGGVMEFLSYMTAVVHYWRDGRYIGTTDPEDSPAGLVEQTVTKMLETS